MNTFHKRFSAKFNQGEDGTFTGYASTFNGEPDSYGDVIAPRAFAKSLEKHTKADTRPALLWGHDQTQPIGVWDHFEETEKGLLGEGRLTLEVQKAKEARALMQDGALSLSIGYFVAPGGAELKDKGVRLLKEIELMEVSLVAIPANPAARITAVKAALMQSPRDFESTVRDALGLSAREAKRLCAGGWAGLVRDEQPDASAELQAIAVKLQTITKQLRNT